MEGKRRSISSRELILPADLLDEILVRLPVKSIIRFESVSKAWISNFRSTFFKKRFNEQHNNSYKPDTVHTMKLEDLYKMVPTLNEALKPFKKRNHEALKPFKMQHEISAMGNGIYCLTSVPTGTSDQIDPLGCQIVLFNPAIWQFNLLPPFPSIQLMDKTSNYRLVCGFGTAPGCLDYRVVVIILDYGSSYGSFLVFVYSSCSGEWEKLVDYVPGKKIVGPSSATRAFTRGEIRRILTSNEVCSQCLLKGCWHWMIEQHENPNLGYYMILSFDFAHQSFDLLDGPPMGYATDNSIVTASVVVLHDHLSVISHQLFWDNDDSYVSVWMMLDYDVKESWTRLFNVNSTCGDKLYRIDYSVAAKDEGGNDNVFIEKLSFIDELSIYEEIISINHHGESQVTPFHHNSKEDIFLNIGGIPSYKETLEHPY